MIPSAVDAYQKLDFWGRFGRWSPVSKRFFVGKQADIGWAAIKACDEKKAEPASKRRR